MKHELSIVLIDNYDSFTYNLVEQCRQHTSDVEVFRNTVSLATITEKVKVENNTLLVLSPGPGRPEDAGNLLAIIKHFSGRTPILGVCLGHQGLVECFGGKVIGANEIVHGKASLLEHCSHPIFETLSQPIRVARYHSLVASEIPSNFEVIAKCDQEVMAIVDTARALVGFQFHPESILTTSGDQLMARTIDWLQHKITKEHL